LKIAAGSRSHRTSDARNVRERLSAELRNVDVLWERLPAAILSTLSNSIVDFTRRYL
jgi:hypothetical protein